MSPVEIAWVARVIGMNTGVFTDLFLKYFDTFNNFSTRKTAVTNSVQRNLETLRP